MVDLALTEAQREFRDAVRGFARREVLAAVDGRGTEDAELPGGEFLRLVRSAAALGLPGLLIPAEYGGGGGTVLDAVLTLEELGAADVGFAAGLGLTMTVPSFLLGAGTAEQRARWLPALTAGGDHVLAGALNEPSVAGSELFDPEPTADRGLTTRARRDGSDYELTGAKAQWVTNAGVARSYLVFARTDPTAPSTAGTSAFWVPADAPGLTVGPRSRLLGMRGACHAEVFLDAVRVPAADRIGPEHGALPLLARTTPAMALGLAAAFVGLARTALETTLAYTAGRTSWGRPLREHQAVALVLADMAADLRAARLVVWDAAAAVDADAGPAELARLVPAAKTRAVDAAIANAQGAVRLHGAAGVTAGAGPERLLRDAWTGYSCDFPGEMLRLSVAAAL